MKVAIATPFYEIKAYSPYIVSLMNAIKVLHEMEMDYEYYELSGDSYVDRAKNTLVHRFLNSDCTHLFMIDSDLAFEPMGFARILKAGLKNAEIVGGAFPNKNNWQTFGCILNHDEKGFPLGKEVNEQRLLDAWGIPGGFILYSREAFERTRSNLKTYHDVFNDITYLECFKCNIEKNGTRVGEDIYFQLRFKEMGGTIWLEPNINFIHYGIKGWGGNYHEYLVNGQDDEKLAEEQNILEVTI